MVVDLPGAVGAEEAVHLALLDGEVEVVERVGGAEGLDDVVQLDDSHAPECRTTFTNL